MVALQIINKFFPPKLGIIIINLYIYIYIYIVCVVRGFVHCDFWLVFV
jgi:hypothetical protein